MESLNKEFTKLYSVVYKTHDLKVFKAEVLVTVTKLPWLGTILNDIGKISFHYSLFAVLVRMNSILVKKHFKTRQDDIGQHSQNLSPV